MSRPLESLLRNSTCIELKVLLPPFVESCAWAPSTLGFTISWKSRSDSPGLHRIVPGIVPDIVGKGPSLILKE
jgi:hypothetical protein